MRVFLSSTVFDLIDVRAEVASQLRSLGAVPVLSDDKLSDFQVHHDANSIETCLINVSTCDEVILILDRRYGPRLGRCGFDDVSATHLEYRRAVQENKPIHVFVRDRLLADYDIWKRNQYDDSMKFCWISEKDTGLFQLLHEHARLAADSSTSNWFTPFTSSIDLKEALLKHLQPKLLPQHLVEAINHNKFPLFDIELHATYDNMMINCTNVLKLSSTITNIGGAPAFNFRIYWDDKQGETQERTIITPGHSVELVLLCGVGGGCLGAEKHLIAEYESPIGISVTDTFKVYGRIQPGIQELLLSGSRLVSRHFKRGSEITFDIDDIR